MTQAEPAASPASRSSVARNAGVVSAAIMASRVLGLVRDQDFSTTLF